jgi:hypothetical protein
MRCTRRKTHGDGSTVETLGCCRRPHEDGPCCLHFTGRLVNRAHVTIHRANGLLIGCGRGAALDGEQPT